MQEERLNKYLAGCGYSRREADRMIREGRVEVDGKRAELGMKVNEDSLVTVDDEAAIKETEGRTIALNKPYGVITTSDKRSTDTVMSLVPSSPRLFPVGRLDVRSSGLLLLTSDGALAEQLTHPKYGHEKEYLVGLEEVINETQLKQLADGIELEDGPTRRATVRRVAPKVFLITLKEGRNRQVRRMCEAIGHKVKTLKRTRFGFLKLGTLEPGQWRDLTAKELAILKGERPRKGTASSAGATPRPHAPQPKKKSHPR